MTVMGMVHLIAAVELRSDTWNFAMGVHLPLSRTTRWPVDKLKLEECMILR